MSLRWSQTAHFLTHENVDRAAFSSIESQHGTASEEAPITLAIGTSRHSGKSLSGTLTRLRGSVRFAQCVTPLLSPLPGRHPDERTIITRPPNRKSVRIPLHALWRLDWIKDGQRAGKDSDFRPIAVVPVQPVCRASFRPTEQLNTFDKIFLLSTETREDEREETAHRPSCSRGIPSSISMTGIFSRMG